MKLRVNCLIASVLCLGITFALQSRVAAGQPLPKDAVAALRVAREVNGLDSASVKPWHIRGSYTFYNEKGKVDDKGVYEEWWVSPSQYKRSFKSKKFAQTEYATGTALYREGSQDWLSGREMYLRMNLISPLPEKELQPEVNLVQHEEKIGQGKLDCIVMQDKNYVPGTAYSNPFFPEACFELNAPVMRMNYQYSSKRVAYDDIQIFQGKAVAHDLTLYSMNKMQGELKLDVVEELKESPQSLLAPPSSAQAVDLSQGVLLKIESPWWPHLIPVANSSLTTPVQLPLPTMAVVRVTDTQPSWPSLLITINNDGYIRSQLDPGLIKIRFVVDANGHVSKTEWLEGSVNSSNDFRNLLSHAFFRPYKVLGKPVPYEMDVAINIPIAITVGLR